MVDVKLDVGGSTAYKSVSKKTNSSNNVCGVLSYLLLIGALAFLALDAMEFISLGIVKDVMGLKVLKTEEFVNITTAFEGTKKKLAEVSGERDGLRGQYTALSGERDDLKNQVNDKQNQLNTVTGERDDFKTKLEAMTVEKDGLTVERDGLKKKIEEAAAAAKAAEDATKAKTKTKDAGAA